MKREWSSCEMGRQEAAKFREYLKAHNIRYEASECFSMVHFEVFVDSKECRMCNDFLETL